MLTQEGHTAGFAVTPSDSQEFEKLHTGIKPTPEELRWTQIPWKPDLWEARQKAAEIARPMFIWAMNGNPLGCV